jgi:hypothetical protein
MSSASFILSRIRQEGYEKITLKGIFGYYPFRKDKFSAKKGKERVNSGTIVFPLPSVPAKPEKKFAEMTYAKRAYA